MATVTGQQVADLVGQGDDAASVALAQKHAETITKLARGYTRGRGFDAGEESDEPNEDLEAVIVAAAARLHANPEQIAYDSGSVVMRGGFVGWSLAETFVLNRYRRRVA